MGASPEDLRGALRELVEAERLRVRPPWVHGGQAQLMAKRVRVLAAVERAEELLGER